MKQLLLYALLGSVLTVCAQQTPCENGSADVFPCNDYDLLSTIDAATLGGDVNAEGSDNWGWVDPSTGREYAIMALTTRTAFIDVTDPLNPEFLGYLPRTSGAGVNFWRDVKVYNNHAFIVADNVGAHGMQVFDLTNLRNVTNAPVQFSPLTTYTGVNSCHNIAINESSGFAYLVGCGGVANGGPHVVDISNPANPQFAGQYSTDGYTHDAQVITYNNPGHPLDGDEILVGANTDEVVFLNVTNKSNITRISRVTYSNLGYTHQGWFTPDQRYYILGDETDEIDFGLRTRTLVFDVSDITNPQLHTTYLGPSGSIDHNLYVVGDLLYEANYTSGLRVIDISDIDNSTTTNNTFNEVGFIDTYPANDGTSFNGAWNVYPFFPSGNIVISDINRGMLVVRKSGTLSLDDFPSIEELRIYPNPAMSQVIVDVPEGRPTQNIQMFNQFGQLVYTYEGPEISEITINTETYQAGLYFVEIEGHGNYKLMIR